MSEVKFPPRIRFSRPHNHAVEMSITDFEDFGDKLEYISVAEHLSKISQLEERLRVAAKYLSDAFPGMHPEIRAHHDEGLAAIKEKKE